MMHRALLGAPSHAASRITRGCIRGKALRPRMAKRKSNRKLYSSRAPAAKTYKNPNSGATFNVPLENDKVVIFSRPVTAFQMNQLLVCCKQSSEAAIVDAGGAPAPFIECAERHNMQIWHLLQTHAHIDHVSGLKETKEKLPNAHLYLHPLDKSVYDSVEQQSHMFGVPFDGPLPDIDRNLSDGEKLYVGDIELKCHHLPGHSPGHVIFVSADHGFVIGGDLLFQGSVGRTDLPMCDPEAMAESIRKLYDIEDLGDDTIVLTGHMGHTTLGAERRSNPFVQSWLSS